MSGIASKHRAGGKGCVVNSQSVQEKLSLEHQAARLFMRMYERQYGAEMRHIWHNEPRKPDVSCYMDGQRLDIEIAHLYGSEQEAMALLGRDLSAQTQFELRQLWLQPSDQRLAYALNKILLSKAEKCYESQRVWLVVRNANPLWMAADIENVKAQVRLPQSHPFQAIWVIGDWSGHSGMVKFG